jgi:hypothetical protein
MVGGTVRNQLAALAYAPSPLRKAGHPHTASEKAASLSFSDGHDGLVSNNANAMLWAAQQRLAHWATSQPTKAVGTANHNRGASRFVSCAACANCVRPVRTVCVMLLPSVLGAAGWLLVLRLVSSCSSFL